MNSNFLRGARNFVTGSLIAICLIPICLIPICLIPAVNAQQPIEVRPKLVVSDEFQNEMAIISQPESPYYKCLDSKL
jgi:hypothetical protein